MAPLGSGPGGRGRECFGIPERCRCERAQQELAREIPGPSASPGEEARKAPGFFGGTGSSSEAAGPEPHSMAPSQSSQAPARAGTVDSIQGQAWHPSPSSPRAPGAEQLSRADLRGSRHGFLLQDRLYSTSAPQRPPGAQPKHEGAPLPDIRLPECSPEPGGHAAAQPESSGNRPQNKAPACHVLKSSPKSFTSSQETDEGFLRRSAGTERGRRSGSTAHGAVPGGSASKEEEEAAALRPLSGTAGLCQQPHRFQRTHSSKLGLAASHPCLVHRLRRSGSTNGPSHAATPHALPRVSWGPRLSDQRHAHQAQTFPTRSFFWSTRCSEQKFP